MRCGGAPEASPPDWFRSSGSKVYHERNNGWYPEVPSRANPGEPEQINFECGDAVREFRYPGSLRAYLTTRGEVVMLVGGELEVNGRTVHREGDSIQTLLQALGEPNYSTGNNEGSGFARYRDAASCLEIYWWDGRVGSLTLSDRSWREQGYESEGRSLMYDKRRGTIYLAQPRDTKGCYWTPNGWESYGPGC